MGSKRTCKGTTKAGKPCRAYAVGDTDRCMAHSPKNLQEKVGFGGAQEGAGRPPNPRYVDILRRRLEERADKYLDVLEDAIEAEKAIVVGAGESASLEFVPDHVVRLRALAELLDRAYGKPRQATEVTGPDGGPIQTEGRIDTSKLSDAELVELAQLLERTGA